MKKSLLLALALLAGLSLAKAATSDTLIIKVTPTGTKGVSIDVPEIDFGNRSIGADNIISTVPISVQNTGNLASSWGLRVENTGTSWAVSNSAGVNTYSLQAIFNSVQPAAGDFNIVEDNLGLADKQCINVGTFGGDENCLNVAPGGVRHLWLNLDMPTSSSATGQQQVDLVITAL